MYIFISTKKKNIIIILLYFFGLPSLFITDVQIYERNGFNISILYKKVNLLDNLV